MKFKQKKCINNLLVLGLCSACLFSCNHKHAFKEVSLDGLTLQLMKMPGNTNEGPEMNYSARLIPTADVLEKKSTFLKNKLWYGMDSCFYLQYGQRKIFAELVQPISNGISGRMEYMVIFQQVDLRHGSWSLIYQDKYINRKKYIVKLDNE